MIYFDEETETAAATSLHQMTLPMRALHQRANEFKSSKLIRNMFEQPHSEQQYDLAAQSQVVSLARQNSDKMLKAKRLVRKRARFATEVPAEQPQSVVLERNAPPEQQYPARQHNPVVIYSQEEYSSVPPEPTQPKQQPASEQYSMLGRRPTELFLDETKESNFNMLLAGCKFMEETRVLLRDIISHPASFKLVRRKNTIYTTFDLLTYDPKDVGEKLFLMATRRFTSVSQTCYPISLMAKVKQSVLGSDYSLGSMTSDFFRSAYCIQSYLQGEDRLINLSFDDVMFGSRQVSLQIIEKPTNRKQRFWNLPEKAALTFDPTMKGSKRNIIIARSKPIGEMKSTDIVLSLRKVAADSFVLTLNRELSVFEAFCFAVAHLDRQA